MKKYLILFTMFLVTGCAAGGSQAQPPVMMGGGDSGMMARHHAQVPEQYAGLTSPDVTDDALLRGAEIYKINCLACHGETAAGDGVAGAALNPLPSPIGHTSQMLSDELVFYRISEGGVEFQTAMPAWKDVLTDEQIWDVIAYVRELGKGNTALIDQMQAAQQDEMLNEALKKRAITQAQADNFRVVHVELEGYIKSNVSQRTMDEREASALLALVDSGVVTQAQVDEFKIVHAILSSGGFMP